MTEEQINTVAEATARAVVREFSDTGRRPCACKVNIQQHEQEHEFVRRAISVVAKVDGVGWSVFQAVAIAGALGVLAILGWRMK